MNIPPKSTLFRIKRGDVIYKDYKQIITLPYLTEKEMNNYINHYINVDLPNTSMYTIFHVKKIRDIRYKEYCLCKIVPIVDTYQGQFLVVEKKLLEAYDESTTS